MEAVTHDSKKENVDTLLRLIAHRSYPICFRLIGIITANIPTNAFYGEICASHCLAHPSRSILWNKFGEHNSLIEMARAVIVIIRTPICTEDLDTRLSILSFKMELCSKDKNGEVRRQIAARYLCLTLNNGYTDGLANSEHHKFRACNHTMSIQALWKCRKQHVFIKR